MPRGDRHSQGAIFSFIIVGNWSSLHNIEGWTTNAALETIYLTHYCPHNQTANRWLVDKKKQRKPFIKAVLGGG